MSNLLFTIIMSTYNRRDLLPRAIKSVLCQTFRDFEFLVIDNGSMDDTAFVVRSFNDNRLKYILNPNPTNSCDGPRNLGMEMAKGSLITFIDDDDIWYPERLEKVKKAFDDNLGVEVVCHNENRRINGEIKGVLEYNPHKDNIYEVLLYEKNCFSPCAVTMKTELLRGLNGFNLRKEFNKAADYDLWLRMMSGGVKVHFIEESLGEFCFTGNNESITDIAFDSKIAFIAKEHILKYEQKRIFNISNRGMKRMLQLYYIAAKSFFRSSKYRDALKYFSGIAFFLFIRPLLIRQLIIWFFRRLNDRKKTFFS